MIIDLLKELNELDEHPTLEAKLLELRGKGSATYYMPGSDFPPLPLASSEHVSLEAQHGSLEARHVSLEAQLPPALRIKIEALGRKPGDQIRPVIRDLCAWRDLSATELTQLFGRADAKALKRLHLRPMLISGDLVHTIPDMERHPNQAYRTPQPKQPTEISSDEKPRI